MFQALSMFKLFRYVRFGVPIDQDIEVTSYMVEGKDTRYEKQMTTIWVDEGLLNLVTHRLEA